MNIIEKVFGTHSERELKDIRPIVDNILALEDEYKALSDEALKALLDQERGNEKWPQ